MAFYTWTQIHLNDRFKCSVWPLSDILSEGKREVDSYGGTMMQSRIFQQGIVRNLDRIDSLALLRSKDPTGYSFTSGMQWNFFQQSLLQYSIFSFENLIWYIE